MWAARDKDGYLQVGDVKPVLSFDEYSWLFNTMGVIILDRNLLPELTFENSPQEVELKLKER